MRIRRGMVVWAAAGAALAGGGWWGFARWVSGPAGELRSASVQYRRAIAEFGVRLESASGARGRLSRLRDTTLGSDEETVNALLRTALNQIGASVGVRELVVSTRPAQGVENPALVRRVWEFRERSVREGAGGAGFSVVRAGVSARGSLEEVCALIETVSGQRWAHRVESVGLEPVSSSAGEMEVSLSLATMYFPGEVGPDRSLALWEPVERGAWFAGVVGKNVFVEPAPEASPVEVVVSEVSPAEPAPVPPPPPPPYGEWRVAGVMVGSGGAELLVVNERTGESRVLRAGERVLGAEFVGVVEGAARIRIDGAEFAVDLNRTLGDRRGVDG